ncbi:hypothetical protein QUB80_13260 [Chlorogloeopsis sp. ULAP01]|uniref:hypothetical protein n=1 Tax=Chlorogloeopsis sp. ULAP01 TaxID=3056483 RepID=UPI0025AADF2B|nr:hypothetical protein [Chlorogloeopsis sp. ULAP01]MDM9381671.1 hypothetical protein [Chlorogloeopsis sp. ULAP01]
MNKVGKIEALLIGGLVFSAAPAMAQLPTFSGPWVVKLWGDSTRAQVGIDYCLAFTKVAGGVAGSPDGGTFTSRNIANWNGQWVQQGDRIRWWGAIAKTVATNSEGTLINPNLATGYYLHYNLLDPGEANKVFSIGTWSAQPGTVGTFPC